MTEPAGTRHWICLRCDHRGSQGYAVPTLSAFGLLVMIIGVLVAFGASGSYILAATPIAILGHALFQTGGMRELRCTTCGSPELIPSDSPRGKIHGTSAARVQPG